MRSARSEARTTRFRRGRGSKRASLGPATVLGYFILCTALLYLRAPPPLFNPSSLCPSFEWRQVIPDSADFPAHSRTVLLVHTRSCKQEHESARCTGRTSRLEDKSFVRGLDKWTTS